MLNNYDIGSLQLHENRGQIQQSEEEKREEPVEN